MNHAQADENARLVFEQICDTARHYSNLRFAMFTVFTAILGVLLGVELGEVGSLPDGPVVGWFRVASLLLAVLFAAAEWRVAELVVFYQERAAAFGERLQLALPPRHRIWRWLARAINMAPFVLAILFWVVALVFWSTERVTMQPPASH